MGEILVFMLLLLLGGFGLLDLRGCLFGITIVMESLGGGGVVESVSFEGCSDIVEGGRHAQHWSRGQRGVWAAGATVKRCDKGQGMRRGGKQ